MNEIYSMEFGDRLLTENFIIFRVPGGWIFEVVGNSMVFVPYNREFLKDVSEVRILG